VWSAAGALLLALTVAVVAADGALAGEVGYIEWWQAIGRPIPEFADVIRLTTGTEGNLVLGLVPGVWLVRRHGRRGAAAVAVVLVAMLIVQPVSKELIDRDRPTSQQVEVRAENSSRSYPSGHSLSTASVWGTAALSAWRTGRRRWAAACVVPIVCTGVASTIQGVHWPSDAVAGTIIGLGAAWIAVDVLRLDERPNDERPNDVNARRGTPG
jgi:membrane-associated phospholipid phosphatase